MIDAGSHRTAFDEFEKFPGRPCGLALDDEHFVHHVKIGHADLHGPDGRTEDAAALRLDAHAVIKLHVGLDMLDDRPALGVINAGIVRLGRHQELPLLRIAEGKITQVAAQHQFGIARRTAGNPMLQPGARIGIDRMRHVAPHRPPVGFVDACAEIDLARPVTVKAVGALRRTGGVRAGKLHPLDLNIDHAGLDAPLRIRPQAVKTDLGLGKYRRQEQGGRPGIDMHRTAALRQINRTAQIFRPGEIALGPHAQAAEFGFHPVARKAVIFPAPVAADLADLTLRRIRLQQVPGLRVERQVIRQMGQFIETQAVGCELPFLCAILCLPVKQEIHRRQLHAAVRTQLQAFCRQLPALCPPGRQQPPPQGGQIEYRPGLPQLHAHTVERQIHGHTDVTVTQFGPQAQCALPVGQRYRIIKPGPPGIKVGIGQIQVDPAIHFAPLQRPALLHIAVQIAAYIQPPRQGRWRQGRQGKPVATTAVVQTHLHIFQHQRRRATQGVLPEQGGISDANMFLGQQPVQAIAAAPFAAADAGDFELAVRSPAHIEHRPFDRQQRQNRPPTPEGVPGQHGIDTGQGQSRTAIVGQQTQIFQHQLRIKALPLRGNPADPYFLPQRRANAAFQRRPVIIDGRQDKETQPQKNSHEQQPCRQQQPAQDAQHAPHRHAATGARQQLTPGMHAVIDRLAHLTTLGRRQRSLRRTHATGSIRLCQKMKLLTRMQLSTMQPFPAGT